MAMMISKFHRLIQSRLIWGAFLVAIVFSFVIWGMVWPSDLDKAEQTNSAGSLDGVSISHSAFRMAHLNSYLARILASGRDFQSTPEMEVLLRHQAWQRIATLREAQNLGITANDEELRSVIRSNFSETDGTYSPARYQAFVQNLIAPMGFSIGMFEQYLREEIQIQKMASLIGRQAVVTPLEVRQTFNTLLDTFVVEYALISPEDVEKDVKVTDLEVLALFDENPAAFTFPEQREVVYAAFPLSDYLDEAAEIAEDDVQDYYELNIQTYTSSSTDTNGQPRETITDLDEVREEIVVALRRQAAREKADSVASELTFRAIPDRDGTIPVFADEAQKLGRTIQTLPSFARFSVPLLDAGVALSVAAFELAPNAYDRVSAPISGADNVYVLSLEKVIAPRTPAFEEVEDRVRTIAQGRALAAVLSAKGKAVQVETAAGIAFGKTFAKAIAGTDLKAQVTPPFTGLSGTSSTNEVVQTLVHAVVSYNAGEVTEPVAHENGLLVAYLQTRTLADPDTFETYQAEIANAIRSRRGQSLFMDWQAALLTPERFTDFQRVTAVDADDEDLEDADSTDTEEIL